MSDRAQNTAKRPHDTDHEKHKPSHADNRRQASAKGANEAWQAQIDASKAKKKPAGKPQEKQQNKPQDKQSKLTLSAEQIKERVSALNKELNKTKQEGPFWDSHKKPDVDPNKVHHILDGLTSADRQAVDKAFKEQNKKHLGVLETLGTKVDKHSGGYSQVEALLKRQDNKTDHAGSVHTELAKIDENGKHASDPIDALLHGQNPIEAQKERSQAEERLLNTIYRAGKELKDLKETSQHDYHSKDKRTLEDEVKNNKHLSPEGKAAALIMLQENWDKDPKKVEQLRRLGLSSHRLDIFEKAMQVSTPQERDMFRKTGGFAQIEKAFGNTDAGAKARDLALIGKEGLEKALADQTWKFSGSNHEQLEDALSKADEKEKALFKKGRDLSLHGDISKKRTADEKEAIDYYQRVHDKLGLIAPFNDGQRSAWEAKLLGTDKKQQVTPSLDKAFKENEENVFDNIFHNKEKSAAKINALIHMSPEEQKRYKDNTEKDKNGKTYRQHVMDMVNTQLKEGPERELAKSILGRVARGEDPSKLDKSEQVLYDHVTGADRSTKIEHIEKALESQESRYRISKGLTPKDKTLKSVIDTELDDLKKSCGYLGDQTADGKHQLNAYLYKTGHVPPELSALSGLNKKTWLEGILNTPPETRKQLADTRALKSWDTTSTQANLIGHAGKEQQEFIQDLLKRTPPVTSLNDKNVSPEDRMRAFALGIGPSPKEIEKELATMDSTQKAAMAGRYFDKYKHDISDDVVAKVPPDQQRHFQDLLSHADVTMGQKAINAREDHDKHKSPADMITSAFSPAESRVDNDLDKIDDYLHKHGEKQLSKAQHDELKKALEDYRQKEKEFIESKGKAAEAFVNATTTIVTIVGSMVQPELAPLALAKLGVLGGAYRFGAMKLIQGNDFDNSARNITEQLFHGSTDVIFNMVAPANLGMKMGATKTAIKEALEQTASKKFTSGLESALKQQLDNMSTKDVLLGSPKAREAIEQAFKEAAIGSTDKGVKEAADTYLKQLQTNTALELLAKETKQAADNIVTGAISTGAAQLTTNIAFPPEGGLTPKELFDKCMKAGGEGAAGAAVFHFGFKGLGMAASGAKGTFGKVLDAAGKDKYFAKDGTVIKHANGTTTTTGKDETWLKPGDTIVPPEKAGEAKAQDPQPDSTPGEVNPLLAKEQFPISANKLLTNSRNTIIKKTQGLVDPALEKFRPLLDVSTDNWDKLRSGVNESNLSELREDLERLGLSGLLKKQKPDYEKINGAINAKYRTYSNLKDIIDHVIPGDESLSNKFNELKEAIEGPHSLEIMEKLDLEVQKSTDSQVNKLKDSFKLLQILDELEDTSSVLHRIHGSNDTHNQTLASSTIGFINNIDYYPDARKAVEKCEQYKELLGLTPDQINEIKKSIEDKQNVWRAHNRQKYFPDEDFSTIYAGDRKLPDDLQQLIDEHIGTNTKTYAITETRFKNGHTVITHFDPSDFTDGVKGYIYQFDKNKNLLHSFKITLRDPQNRLLAHISAKIKPSDTKDIQWDTHIKRIVKEEFEQGISPGLNRHLGPIGKYRREHLEHLIDEDRLRKDYPNASERKDARDKVLTHLESFLNRFAYEHSDEPPSNKPKQRRILKRMLEDTPPTAPFETLGAMRNFIIDLLYESFLASRNK